MEHYVDEISEMSLGYLINKTALYYRVSMQHFFKSSNFGITLVQFGVLYVLSKSNGLYQRQLGKILIKDRPNITRIVDLLELKSLVYREADPNNRRISKVFITDKGIDTVNKLEPFIKNWHRDILLDFPQEEIVNLKKTLKSICQKLDSRFKLQI